MTLAPISCKKSLCFINVFFVSSNGFVVKNALNQALAISMFLNCSAFFKIFGSRGNLLPTSVPVNPASAISLIHCSNVFSIPKSGISSLVHAIGAIPSLIAFSLNKISHLLNIFSLTLIAPLYLEMPVGLLLFLTLQTHLHATNYRNHLSSFLVTLLYQLK